MTTSTRPPLRQVWAPVLTLMVSAPLLAEVFGGAMPLLDFVQPGVFFPFVVFLYGLPLLVIRELSTRYGLGPAGIWVLGMTYALFNEGLLSETLYAGLDHAVPAYADYGLVGGLRVPWVLYILPWHATLSVLTPVLVVDRVFSRTAGRPWLPARLTWALAVAVPALAVTRFVAWGEDRTVADAGTFAGHLGFVLAAGALVCLAAVGVTRRQRFADETAWSGMSWRCFVLGAAAYAVLTPGSVALATVGVPAPVCVAYSMLATGGVGWLATRSRVVTRSEALATVLGAALVQAGTGVVAGSLAGNVQWLAVCVVLAVAATVWVSLLERTTGRVPAGL